MNPDRRLGVLTQLVVCPNQRRVRGSFARVLACLAFTLRTSRARSPAGHDERIPSRYRESDRAQDSAEDDDDDDDNWMSAPHDQPKIILLAGGWALEASSSWSTKLSASRTPNPACASHQQDPILNQALVDDGVHCPYAGRSAAQSRAKSTSILRRVLPRLLRDAYSLDLLPVPMFLGDAIRSSASRPERILLPGSIDGRRSERRGGRTRGDDGCRLGRTRRRLHRARRAPRYRHVGQIEIADRRYRALRSGPMLTSDRCTQGQTGRANGKTALPNKMVTAGTVAGNHLCGQTKDSLERNEPIAAQLRFRHAAGRTMVSV
jgi:hypothetical protein